MNVRAAPTAKYLARYATPDAAAGSALAAATKTAYAEAIVVPARRERAALVDELLACEAPGGRLLVVLVVNQSDAGAGRPTGADPAAASGGAVSRTASGAADPLLEAAAARGGRPIGAPSLGATWIAGAGADLLVLDRASPGRRLAAREGVGRARKIGVDAALVLRAAGRLESELIHTTDADAAIDAPRFRLAREALAIAPDAAAVTLPFVHAADEPALEVPVALHEIFLRHHVLGLAFAGSPYAFHSIGSLLAVRAESYAAVRGFPNREAGEDFHFLDKAAKTGAIVQPAGEPVVVAGRESDRVPFGTGPSIRRLAAAGREAPLRDAAALRGAAGGAGEDAGSPLLLPAALCFEALRDWIAALERFAVHGDAERFRRDAAQPEIDDALGASAALARLAGELRAGPPRLRAFHVWFDGLRTLRFLQAVRDLERAVLPWNEALAGAPFTGGIARRASAAEALAALRERDRGPRVAGVDARVAAVSAGE